MIVRQTLTAGDPLFLADYEVYLGRAIGESQVTNAITKGCKPRVQDDHWSRRSNSRAGALATLAVARKLNLNAPFTFRAYPSFNLRLSTNDPIKVQWDLDGVCIVDQKREAEHRAQGKEVPALHIIVKEHESASALVAARFADDEEYYVTGAPHLVFAGWCTHEEALAGDEEDRDYGPCWVQRGLRQTLEILTGARGEGHR